MNGITQHIILYIWYFSILFQDLPTLLYTDTHSYCYLYSSVDEHLDSFNFMDITNNAAMNILIHVFW